MAKKQSGSASERLAALVADRERYRQWLIALEAERAGVPDHVYARIRDDYAAKLQAVVDELASHVEAIEAMLEERQTALHEADADAAARTDALLEAEVRFRIGEFDEKHWNELRGKLEAEIAEAEKQRDALNAQVTRLRGIMQQLTSEGDEIASEEIASDDPKSDDTDPNAFIRQLLAAAAAADPGDAPHTAGRSIEAVRGGAVQSTASKEKAPAKPMRTVECPRCGTFNFPDVEHCDACGGALAVAP
ncbi:MAG TPA: zinc finger Ran-binding domain-containing protein [Longimicrobiales bacterium]